MDTEVAENNLQAPKKVIIFATPLTPKKGLGRCFTHKIISICQPKKLLFHTLETPSEFA